MNIIKGKFLFLINNIMKFEKDELYKIYNITKGSIQYIFEYNYGKNKTFYLLRTKIIKDIIDSDKIFEDYNQFNF